MSGIGGLTVDEFKRRIQRFERAYIADWNGWLSTQQADRAERLGSILRGWQACRPNRMRRTRVEGRHDAPYLEDLIHCAGEDLRALDQFELREEASFSTENLQALARLWDIFSNLSYVGRARNGLAGVVGISKAVLLLTEGRVGPAFDSTVRVNLGLRVIDNSCEWINALQVASRDIQMFERKNDVTLHAACPEPHSQLRSGRIYDMALGPGAGS